MRFSHKGFFFIINIVICLNDDLKRTYYRLKIGQPFRDHQKLNQKFKCDKTIWDEFGWIVDIIEHYKKVTMYVPINYFCDLFDDLFND